MFLYKEKTGNNYNIHQELNNKFSDDDVKGESIIKGDESNNANDNTQRGSSANVSNKRIEKCESFEMRKSNTQKFGIVKKQNISVGRINLTHCARGLRRIKGD